MLKRYKNASVLNRFDEKNVFDGDIVIDGDHICYIDPSSDEIKIDLNGKTIIPSFKNYDCNLFGLNEEEIENVILKNIESGATDIVACADNYEICKRLFEKFHLDYKIALPFDVIKNLNCDEHMLIYVDPLQEDENTLDELSDFAAKNGLKLLIKLFDNLDQTGRLNSSKKMLPISYIESFGLLDRGGTLLGAIWSDKEDYSILNSYDFDVTIRPISDLRKGNGFANVKQIQNAGLDLNIGTDDETEIDFFRQGRAVLLGTRGMLSDKDAISEDEVMKILTGNKTLLDGEKASFIVLDGKYDSARDILDLVDKKDVYMTISNGEVIYKKGETK